MQWGAVPRLDLEQVGFRLSNIVYAGANFFKFLKAE